MENLVVWQCGKPNNKPRYPPTCAIWPYGSVFTEPCGSIRGLPHRAPDTATPGPLWRECIASANAALVEFGNAKLAGFLLPFTPQKNAWNSTKSHDKIHLGYLPQGYDKEKLYGKSWVKSTNNGTSVDKCWDTKVTEIGNMTETQN